MTKDNLYHLAFSFFTQNSRYNFSNPRGAKEVFEKNYQKEINCFAENQFIKGRVSSDFLVALSKNAEILNPKNLALLLRFPDKPAQALDNISQNSRCLNDFFLGEFLKDPSLERSQFKNLMRNDKRMVRFIEQDFFSTELKTNYWKSNPIEGFLSKSLSYSKNIFQFLLTGIGATFLVSLGALFLYLVYELSLSLPMEPWSFLASIFMGLYGGLFLIYFGLENLQEGRLNVRHKKLLGLAEQLPDQKAYNL